MRKEIIHVSPISEALAKAKVPLSPAVKANGFVFVSGLPPFDRKTGALVKGDISVQTEASLENVKAALEGKRCFDPILMRAAYLGRCEPC